MMNKMVLIAVTSLFATNVAFAASNMNATPDDMNALPPAKTAGPITYITGGVGLVQSQAFEKAARNYPLELEFVVKAKPRDQFNADVNVNILDAHGKSMLKTVSNGPFLLAKLPAGRYSVQATDESGRTIVRHVGVTGAGHQRLVFEWTA